MKQVKNKSPAGENLNTYPVNRDKFLNFLKTKSSNQKLNKMIKIGTNHMKGEEMVIIKKDIKKIFTLVKNNLTNKNYLCLGNNIVTELRVS